MRYRSLGKIILSLAASVALVSVSSHQVSSASSFAAGDASLVNEYEPEASSGGVGGAMPEVQQMQGELREDGATVYMGSGSEVIIHPAEEEGEGTLTQVELANTIECSLNVQYVHESTHERGTINGMAVGSCTGNMASLTLHYSLSRLSPAEQWAATSVSNSGASRIENNRAISCAQSPGEFTGWAQLEATPPPGYQGGPPSQQSWGSTQFVDCVPSGHMAGPGEPALAEKITITFTRIK